MSRTGVAILGSTGSIGTQTLDVIAQLGEHFNVVSLAAGSNIDLLAKQVATFDPHFVVARTDETTIGGKRVLPTPEGLVEAVTHPDVDIVVVATSGHEAIRATWAAIEAGKTIAIANKETIVCAGELIIPLAAKHSVEIRPVDSEHSAIWQCLLTAQRRDLARLILTASGGPFLRTPADELANVTVEKALAHPNWSMGSKITIDSATLMNKGLEVIEAHHLFAVPYGQIEVVIHREQIVHSMVEWNDRTTIAQVSFPDMKLPIQYALTYPRRLPGPCAPLDFTRMTRMSFEELVPDQFPAFSLARQAGIAGRTYPTVLSAADEVAVTAFLSGRIGFTQIAPTVESTMSAHHPETVTDLDVVFEADHWARTYTNRIIERATADG
ncbi:MAG: 1-deoxy-D-xylulose-5-phosphate reductoisomerase, partial [Chloroflexota bacterium]|nr:1-deoxy-D-xylulose-5-phosphate reductoisomerase [Chloroflexota bacterium]